MALSVFAGKFIEYDLTYTVDSGTLTEDEYGNEMAAPGTPQTVRAYLDTPNAPNLRMQIGADVVDVAYQGRLTNPSVPPPGFITGTRVSFVMDGRTVEGRVRVFAPVPVPGLDAKLGREIQVAANG